MSGDSYYNVKKQERGEIQTRNFYIGKYLKKRQFYSLFCTFKQQEGEEGQSNALVPEIPPDIRPVTITIDGFRHIVTKYAL